IFILGVPVLDEQRESDRLAVLVLEVLGDVHQRITGELIAIAPVKAVAREHRRYLPEYLARLGWLDLAVLPLTRVDDALLALVPVGDNERPGITTGRRVHRCRVVVAWLWWLLSPGLGARLDGGARD